MPTSACDVGDDHFPGGEIFNIVVEQDHRAVKRVTRPILGFKAFAAAQATLVGIELMHMIKERQLRVDEGEEALTLTKPF